MSYGDVSVKLTNVTTSKLVVFGRNMNTTERSYSYTAFQNGRFEIPSDGLEGFSQASNDVNVTDYASAPGGYMSNIHAASTERTITACWKGSGRVGDNEDVRISLFALLSYGDEINVAVTRWGRTLSAVGYVRDLKISCGNIYEEPAITITLVFPNPFWRGDSISAYAAVAQDDNILACTFPSSITSDVHDVGFVMKITASGLSHTQSRIYINGSSSQTKPQTEIFRMETSLSYAVVDTTGNTLSLGGFSLTKYGLQKQRLNARWANNSVGIRFYEQSTAVAPTGVKLEAYAIPLFLGV